jgi:Holliday junction resolvase RusA-like endonuclease
MENTLMSAGSRVPADGKDKIMGSIVFKVPGKPQGKARARTGYNPKVGKVTSYTPGKTVLYENYIKTCYMQTTDVVFDHEEPLSVYINACFEPTKSTSKKQRKRMLNGEVLPTKKPDVDNIVKAVLDALNGLAYKDDTQVVNVAANKTYGERAFTEVAIVSIEK